MPTTPASAGGSFLSRFFSRSQDRSRRQIVPPSAIVALMITLAAAGSAAANPDLEKVIGNVDTFSKGSDGKGAPWTLGDKDWSFLDATGDWTGAEKITLTINGTPSLLKHGFVISSLSAYQGPITLELGYLVKINGADGPSTFASVLLDSSYGNPTTDVWKDVYTSYDDFLNDTHNDPWWVLHSQNGVPDFTTFTGGLTELWVRDRIELSTTGQLYTINNDFAQTAVPEIDPNSFASALAVVMGGLSLLERRARRGGRQSTAV